jgi:hypothetical protein
MVSATSKIVGRLLALGAFHHRDHAVEEGLARVRGHLHDQPVGQHAGAAGHARKVAARFADHRRRFARDRAFVDRGDTLDHLAVDGHQVARLDQDVIPFAQVGGGAGQPGGAVLRQGQLLGRHALLQAAQRRRLRLAAAFGQRFREVREQHREPQPDGASEDEAARRFAGSDQRLQVEQGRDDAADVDHEHDGAAQLGAHAQLAEGVDQGRTGQRGVEHGQALAFGRRRHRRRQLGHEDSCNYFANSCRCSAIGPSASAGT